MPLFKLTNLRSLWYLWKWMSGWDFDQVAFECALQHPKHGCLRARIVNEAQFSREMKESNARSDALLATRLRERGSL